ncbi:hypothetical protein NLC29_02075, partial [Candidatus Aminicenantes bacterium AH-873-B07]|nr:hypothetical protein [Candidatus Aminicenantes bacterium AH-873-B07]
GVIDIDPKKVGKDMGEILKLPEKTGIIVSNNSKEIFEKSKAIAVIHTTSSYLPQVFPQIKECIEAGLNVISTCEELSFPYKRHPELAKEIDSIAKKHQVTVVGTGINPGYLMDTLPLTLTGPCLEVKSIKVTRIMNSAKRRIPFQKKVGTGLNPEEFKKYIDERIITGHVGLLESINMIADGLGWKLDEAKELPPEPVIAEKEIDTPLCKVIPGKVLGLKSIAYGKIDGKEVIKLSFIAYAGVEEEYDEIIIEGKPNIHQKIIGGVHGDIGTIATTINTIPKAINALPGLYTMKDLPVPSATPMDMRIYIKG